MPVLAFPEPWASSPAGFGPDNSRLVFFASAVSLDHNESHDWDYSAPATDKKTPVRASNPWLGVDMRGEREMRKYLPRFKLGRLLLAVAIANDPMSILVAGFSGATMQTTEDTPSRTKRCGGSGIGSNHPHPGLRGPIRLKSPTRRRRLRRPCLGATSKGRGSSSPREEPARRSLDTPDPRVGPWP
jgi:hypothetical protein